MQTQNLMFVRSSMSDIFKRVATLRTVKKDRTVVMWFEVMKWRNKFCVEVNNGANL